MTDAPMPPELLAAVDFAKRDQPGPHQPGAAGEWLRLAPPTGEHSCDLPESAQPSSVWRCRCGRRWTCIAAEVAVDGVVWARASWERRWWPWPRKRTNT